MPLKCFLAHHELTQFHATGRATKKGQIEVEESVELNKRKKKRIYEKVNRWRACVEKWFEAQRLPISHWWACRRCAWVWGRGQERRLGRRPLTPEVGAASRARKNNIASCASTKSCQVAFRPAPGLVPLTLHARIHPQFEAKARFVRISDCNCDYVDSGATTSILRSLKSSIPRTWGSKTYCNLLVVDFGNYLGHSISLAT